MTTLEASLKLRDQFTAVLKTIDNRLDQATQTMNTFKQEAAGPAQALNQMISMTTVSVNKLNSHVSSELESVWNVATSMTERIITLFGNFGNRISTIFQLNSVTEKFGSLFTGILSKASATLSAVGKMFQKNHLNPSVLSTSLLKLSSGFEGLISTSASAALKIGSHFSQAFRSTQNSFKPLQHDLKNGFSLIKESMGQVTTGVKSFVTALGLQKIASAGLNALKNSFDGAMDRFDTLNQFPKMMQAVGFAMDEVETSHQRLVEGIDGLPTALNDIVPTTQRIATMTGDLENATRTTISLNNAFLASGTDSARASQGLEQYVQMLGRGEVNLTSWQSLMDTMPVALNDVAKAMGFTGKSAQYDLYDALNEGHVTFDQFNAKLIELFDTGTEGAKRALIGSEGIKTSFKNIQTAVTNGVEGSIRKLDELTEAFTGKNIAQHLDSGKELVREVFRSINGYMDESGQYLEGFMDKIPGIINKVKPYLEVLKNAFNDLKEPIGNALSTIKNSLVELISSFGSEESVAGFQGFMDSIVYGITQIAEFAKKHSDKIAKLILILPKLAMGFIGFKIGKGILSPLLTFGKGLGTILSATGKLGGNFLSLFGFGKENPGKNPLESIGGEGGFGDKSITNPLSPFLDTLNGFAKGATNLALVFGVILLIKQAAKAMEVINKSVPSNFGKFAKKLGNMAIALIGMGTFVIVAGKLAKKDPASALAGLAMVAGISANLLLAAEAMKQIDQKVPDEFGSFAVKLGVMGVAIGGMGVLIGIVGMLTKMNPVAALAGLAMIALISLELMIVANAMQQVDRKVPDDMGAFATKVANMAIAIGSFALLAGAIGAVMATGIGGVAIIAGLVVIALVALELMLVAEVIKQVNQKVPDNIGNFASKIANMAMAIGAFAGLATVIGLVMATGIGGAAILLGLAAIALVALELMLVAEAIKQVDEKIPNDFKSVKGKIDSMVDIIYYFGQANLASIGDIFNNLMGVINSVLVIEILNQLIQIADKLVELGEVEVPTTIESKIKRIMQAIEALEGSTIKELIGTLIQAAELKIVEDSIETMTRMIKGLSTLNEVSLDSGGVIGKIEEALAVTEAIAGEGSLMSKIKNYFGSKFDKEMFSNMDESVELIAQIANKLTTLQTISFNSETLKTKLSEIMEIGNLIGGDIGLFAKLKNVFSSKIDSALFTELEESIRDLTRLADEFSILQTISFNSKIVEKKINEILEIGDLIGGEGGFFAKLGKFFNSKFDASSFVKMNDCILSLNEVANGLSLLQAVSFDPDAIKKKVTDITEIGDLIAGEDGFFVKLGNLFSSKFDSGIFTNINASINTLIQMANDLVILQETTLNYWAVSLKIEEIKNIIQQLNEFQDLLGLKGMDKTVSTLVNLVEELDIFISKTEISLSGLESISTAFESNMTVMQTSTETAMNAIHESAKSSMDELNSAIEAGMNTAVLKVESGRAEIVNAVSGLHGELFSAGQQAMTGLTAGIQAGAGSAIAAAQSVANRVSETVQKALDIRSPSRVMMDIGVFVSEGLANGMLSAEKLVQSASEALTTATIPDQLATFSASGVVISEVQVDDHDISRIKASASPTINVHYKQVVPQVTVHVTNNGSDPIDIEELTERVEEVILEAYHTDLS